MTAQVMIAQHRDLRQLLAGLLTHNLSIARLTGDIAGKEVTLEMPDELAMVRPRPRWRSRFALLAALVVVLKDKRVLGVVHHSDVLRAYNRVLLEAHAEEHDGNR